MEHLSSLIQKQAENLLEEMDFRGEVRVHSLDVNGTVYKVEILVAEDQHFLIGQYGVNLVAFQHLLRLLCRRETKEYLNLIVDVNGYLEEKRQALEGEARKALEEVLRSGASVALRPMLPYERKIIHTFFAEDLKVVSESVGTGTERKVQIRLKD